MKALLLKAPRHSQLIQLSDVIKFFSVNSKIEPQNIGTRGLWRPH